MRARILVNAAGPWVNKVLDASIAAEVTLRARLVKGSHIVVPRRSAGPQAYIFQNTDRRIVFAIPYERDFTLIGTTDLPYQGDPQAVAISAEETSYLCEAVNRYLVEPVAPGDVVWSYSGVRPLYDDLRDSVSAVTRDYVFDVDSGSGDPDGDAAPLLSIFGGKITTYRKLAEHALDKLLPRLGAGRPSRPAWTEHATLPGGELPRASGAFTPKSRVASSYIPASTRPGHTTEQLTG